MADTVLNGSDCCPETTQQNPKARLRSRSSSTGLHLYNLQNPIPSEIEDTDDLKSMFKKWRFIPYAGTTKESGQSLLIWYLMLEKLSPTHNACISKKVKYAVGSKVRFTRAQDPEFEITDEETNPLSVNEQISYRDLLNEFFEFENGIGDFHRNIARNFEITGNALVEMSFAETLGVIRVNLKVHRPTHWLFLETEPDEPKIVAISPIWTDSYLNKHEPRYVPLSVPGNVQWVKENGVFHTVFQLKNGDNTWYGRPESQGSDVYKYREVQDEIYLVKEAGANFTGRVIIEVEDTDPEHEAAIDDTGAENQQFENFADRFRQNFTHQGENPQSVLVTSRPYGSRPMLVFQVKPNTNENWYKVTGEIAENKILRSHGLTRGFLGFEVQHGFATDVFISDYVMNNAKTIEDLRDRVTKFTNAIITEGLKIINREQFNQFSITFATPIQGAIDEYKEAQSTIQQTQNEPDNSIRSSETRGSRGDVPD